MTTPIVVNKGRTTVLSVALGFDVSADTLVSEIRADEDVTSELLATWAVTFANDGVDGELILTLDDADTLTIERTKGFMDIKRVSGGEPLSVFSKPLEVVFRGVVTA